LITSKKITVLKRHSGLQDFQDGVIMTNCKECGKMFEEKHELYFSQSQEVPDKRITTKEYGMKATILQIAENGVAQVNANSANEALDVLNSEQPMPSGWVWKYDGKDNHIANLHWAHQCQFESCNHNKE